MRGLISFCRIFLGVGAVGTLFLLNVAFAKQGVLVTAHGGAHHGGGHHGGGNLNGCQSDHVAPWDRNVIEAVAKANETLQLDVEIAFGMWDTQCIANAITRLDEKMANRGEQLTELVVLPLFLSDHSTVIRAQKYILKQSEINPLPMELDQVEFSGRIEFLSAMNFDEIISQIVKKRAGELVDQGKSLGTETAAKMELTLVMHGPVSFKDNHRWLEMGHRYASDLTDLGFAEIHVVSLQDDAESPVRDRASQILRENVSGAVQRGHLSLVLPLLISTNGIEKGIVERLANLNYVWQGKTLLPDEIFSQFIIHRLQNL